MTKKFHGAGGFGVFCPLMLTFNFFQMVPLAYEEAISLRAVTGPDWSPGKKKWSRWQCTRAYSTFFWAPASKGKIKGTWFSPRLASLVNLNRKIANNSEEAFWSIVHIIHFNKTLLKKYVYIYSFMPSVHIYWMPTCKSGTRNTAMGKICKSPVFTKLPFQFKEPGKKLSQ